MKSCLIEYYGKRELCFPNWGLILRESRATTSNAALSTRYELSLESPKNEISNSV